MPIAWRELYAIVVACATWGYSFSWKHVVFDCDDDAHVCSIVSGVSKNVEIMTLIRRLFFTCSCCNFVLFTLKINVLAYTLSGNDIENFIKIVI